jgi:uracil DNA glycosylase
MDTLRELLEEAKVKGYKSPLPNLLRTIVPMQYIDNDVPPGFGDSYWETRLYNILTELPAWELPLRNLYMSGALKTLAKALDRMVDETGETLIKAPLPDNIFRAYRELSITDVNVVFLGQDPYPTSDKSRQTLETINTMGHADVTSILGEGYDTWKLTQSKPWPEKMLANGPRPIVRIGAVPYAIGKSFAFPKICKEPPISFQNLRKCAIASVGKVTHMDSELVGWSQQGILMLNACPCLYGEGSGSNRNPNIWTTWTTEMLAAIAKIRPYCVFILLGNSAKSYKASIIESHSGACVIETGHPSSRNSSVSDFLNSDIFRRINEFRTSLNLKPIVW